jgi:hypothetical protein
MLFFEKKTQPLISRKAFYKRQAWHLLMAAGILLFCLGLGVAGYHYTAGIPWLDALHNASMILSGMGPVVSIDTVGGKWFSSAYALFSGIVFITNIGVILAPAIHRIFHRLHIDEQD